MNISPDTSFMYKDVKKVPGFNINLGKGSLEIDYVEGMALTRLSHGDVKSFLIQKPNGREENIKLFEEVELREGHFLALVYAVNWKADTKHLIGVVNHSTENYFALENIDDLPKSNKTLTILALAAIVFAIYFCYTSLFSGLDLPVLRWSFSIIWGITFGIATSIYLNRYIVRPMTTNRVKKKLEPYLKAIYQTRAD